MKNKIGVTVMLMIGILLGIPGRSMGKVQLFGQIEYLTPANAHENTENAWEAELQERFDDGSVSSDISGGVGFRLGVMAPVSKVKGLDIGCSIGYIKGPDADFKVTLTDFPPFAETHQIRDEYEVDFTRILFHVRQNIPLNKIFALRLVSGIGVAFGKLKNENIDNFTSTWGGTGSYGDPVSKNFSGLSYEVGPAIAFTGSNFNAELAITYQDFPKMDPDKDRGQLNEGLQEFKWNPIGIRLGVEFGGN